MASGGSSIGAMGRQTLRERTVLVTEVTAAAFETPSTLPSASAMGTPSCISGRRVNATFAPPASTTAAYGTAIPSRFTAGGPASTSFRAPTAMPHETPTASA